MRRRWALVVPLVLAPLAVTPAARADSGSQPYPVINTQYIYDQDRYMSDSYHNRISGGDGDTREGFEDVPARHTVLVSRDLQVTLADLAP